MLKDRKPEIDSTVVERLRLSGAVSLGKLQMTEGAFADHHPAIQPPLNPWSPAHWSGASSSGSGVARAAGLDAPEGQICIDPKSQHVSHRKWQISVDAKHDVTVERSWDRIEPYWLGEIGCDLTKNDPKDQYTPSYPPTP